MSDAKVCPSCEFSNSPSKKYCDSCGTDLQLIKPGSPQAPQAAPQAPAFGSNLPQAGRIRPVGEQASEAAKSEAAKPASQVKFYPDDEAKSGLGAKLGAGAELLGRAVHQALVLIVIAVAAGVSVFAGLYLWRVTRPEFVVPNLGKEYLDALHANDYATAYGMLSDSSKASCTMEEFRQLRTTTGWSWSGLKLAVVEKDIVILEYDLTVADRPLIKDTLSFVKEDGKWVRPYSWHAIKAAEDSFARNDPDLALFKAGEAVRIDERDPMARGYLCESVYYRQLPDRALTECRKTLDLAARYPSKLSERSLYHIHDILADAYMTLGQPASAAEQFTQMLAFPNLAPEDRCALLGNRADAYGSSGKLPEANADLQQARTDCPSPNPANPGRKRPQPLLSR